MAALLLLSRGGNMRAGIFFLLLLVVSFKASAAYYYTISSGEVQYSTPDSACAVLLSTYTDVGYTNLNFNHWGTATDGDASVTGSGYCFYNRTDKWNEVSVKRHPTHIYRKGQADAPHVPNACASAPSAIVSRGPYSSVVRSDGNNYVVGTSPFSVCSENCLYEKPEISNTKDCFVLSNDPQTGFCNYAFTLVTDDNADGTSCSTNTAVPYETGSSLNGSIPGEDESCDSTVTGNTCDETGGGDGSGGTGGGGSGEGSGDGSGSDQGFTTPGNPDLDAREGQRKARISGQYQGFYSTLQQSATYTTIKTAFQNIGDPSASCPVATIDILGTNITFDSHCVIFESIAPTLSFVFMAAWALLAVLIILSA